jgi:parallel beta-helix repeat protein
MRQRLAPSSGQGSICSDTERQREHAEDEMKLQSRSPVRFLTIALVAAAAGLTSCFGFCGSSTSPAFAAKKPGLKGIFINAGTTHFVGVNGSDSGPGTADRPWATLNHAAELAEAGDTVIVGGGHYLLPAQVRPRHSGRSDSWITFMGYPGAEPILDAKMVSHSSLVQKGLDNGALQIQDVSYVRVVNLTIINSFDAGITVRDSSNIDLINNTTRGTFSSGIAVWDTNHDDQGTGHIRILGNTITHATTWDLAPPDVPRQGEPPHEALSIGGAVEFEVAYNHVYDSDKEGIDIKETSKHGKVHHNLISNVERQGVYVDAWFGKLSDIEIYSNVIHGCKGAGLALSVENGESVANVNIYNNLVFNNDGSGLYFSRWGVNNERRHIQIHNNTFYHNGYGTPKDGQTYYWMTGGLYLYSPNVRDVSINSNIFSDNRGFQIGYSELFLKDSQSWRAVARDKSIRIIGNLIDGPKGVASPIESGGNPVDRVRIYAVDGEQAIFANPLFRDPAHQDFALRRNSPADVGVAAGAYAPGLPSKSWWRRDFPPRLFNSKFE